MEMIIHKIGDSVVWKVNYKQSDGVTPVDLTGYTIDVDAYNKQTNELLFNIISTSPNTNSYITTDLLSTGQFSIIIKNTSTFTVGTYNVDIEYTDSDGFTKSSKSILLKLVERL